MDSWMTIFVPANRCEQSRRRELQKQPKSRGGVKPRRSSCRIYALNRPAGRNHARCEPSWTLLRAAGNNTGLYQEKTGEHLSRRDVQRASGGFQHLSMDAETSSWRTQMCLREAPGSTRVSWTSCKSLSRGHQPRGQRWSSQSFAPAGSISSDSPSVIVWDGKKASTSLLISCGIMRRQLKLKGDPTAWWDQAQSHLLFHPILPEQLCKSTAEIKYISLENSS
uniref:uncharacterized protein LOC118551966 isoform X2 n=1 Tax=Halichoerus grypus TaxID=9711 RepID=UPI00165937BC|nr:uncharacterized protein LOC118551966 isoform X2 [Halichoerus grypus]